ncbi:hypothetical protein [Rheinheimera sp. EpRS3]|uniref:hypothetical protein n=1 Tax=Rheinheimera sp. EpRS3 TaxID=1712383 RepID=UPI0007493E5A|nr:hypothetical protein [Rheinheimera sp. EpRS3]KUM53699.1 hypothetical protein AR688_18715 [Rheinheimera sp. EpRS3]
MSNIEESEFVKSKRGKWSKSGVPHRGWRCVDIEDLGEPSTTCGMCESQEIRFVHFMEHSNYPEVLQVGCVCAGHMEGNLAASQAREASMKSRAAKRKRWVTRAWKISAKGNPHITADGYRITVYPRGNGWACTLAGLVSGAVQHSRRYFKTIEEAKLAAFDHITKKSA